jgi:hypothetical protein
MKYKYGTKGQEENIEKRGSKVRKNESETESGKNIRKKESNVVERMNK